MSMSPEDRAKYFASDTEGDQTDAQRRAATKQRLRDMGFDVSYTDSDLLDIIDNLLNRKNPYTNNDLASDIFSRGLGGPSTGDPFAYFKGAEIAGKSDPRYKGFENSRDAALSQMIAAYLSQNGPQGPAPAVIQLPNDEQAFKSMLADATGPSPDSLYRDVFSEAYPDISKGTGPFERFVQGQEKELEARFQQQTFNEFTSPGYADSLKAEYESLAKQEDQARMDRTGGTFPSYEDFIKNKVSSNYMTFLAGEKPKLAQAFQMASPEERYGSRARALPGPTRVI